MKRIECLHELAPLITDELIVVGISGVNYEWRVLCDRPGNIHIGSLGQATSVGVGLALSLPHRRVIVLESDGSALFDLPAIVAIGGYRPANLTVIVFDDGIYGVGEASEPSATSQNTDLATIARGAGIPEVASIADVGQFAALARAVVKDDPNRPRYAVIDVTKDFEVFDLPRPRVDYLENKYRFGRYVERTENIEIFPPLH
jgi:sulfopyruvate decarboxylase subunit beta